MKEIYKVETHPLALEENMIVGEKYRITFLTDGLVRLEYDEEGAFEDRPTQTVFFRDFPKVEYRVVRTEDGIEVHTKRVHIIYNEKEFSGSGLSIQVKGNISAYHSIWHYGEEIHDLKGTARTLDMADGAIELEHGIVSGFGYSLLDDSKSQILLEDGWIEPRKKGIQDLYFFGYGHDYKEALRDFYKLCGTTPMLPRYALGNWWSRYYKYTEETYMELMDRFADHNVPFTVAVIDMDWHLVNIDPKYGSGWTGYTWNKELFPDPARFLQRLHERGMHTTLNVHPADGVRGHEEMYEAMAKAMGVDFEAEDPVICDPASPKFMEAYFEHLHHPREDEGVDFWWIDWQQGNHSKIEGLDPLWIFNHFHFLDNKRNNKRPMTFSRYAGPGSHRYPVGFSGDTVTTWESLDFQPYFTTSATNIGYGWWSHDIGGHMLGYKNDEMVARWTQYGIYSPIMRLHSSNSEFNGKEPWRFKKETEVVMEEALRERHRMLPYLYTMNYRSYKEGLPIVEPIYYEYPENVEAYEMKNQYFFGSELMVAPVTTPRVKKLNMAKTQVWIPEGIWYDLYTGMRYEGGRKMDMYRSLESIPVLAKAGGILATTEEIKGTEAGKNPQSLNVKVFPGACGRFSLYEDDNETCAYEDEICVTTDFDYKECEEAGKAVFTISPAQGHLELIPEKRSYEVELWSCKETVLDSVEVCVDGEKVEASVRYEKDQQRLYVSVPETAVTKEIRISVAEDAIADENLVEKYCFDFLNQAEIGFVEKDRIYQLILSGKKVPIMLSELKAMGLEDDLYGVLMEMLTA